MRWIVEKSTFSSDCSAPQPGYFLKLQTTSKLLISIHPTWKIKFFPQLVFPMICKTTKFAGCLKPKGVSVYKLSVWFAAIYVIWKKKLYFINLFSCDHFFWPASRNFLKLLPEKCTMLPTRSKDISTMFVQISNHNTNNTRFINWDTFTLLGETKLEVSLRLCTVNRELWDT